MSNKNPNTKAENDFRKDNDLQQHMVTKVVKIHPEAKHECL